MKKLHEPLSNADVFQDIKRETKYVNLFNTMMGFPGLHQLRFKKLSFKGSAHFNEFLRSIDRFEKVIKHHFYKFQTENQQMENVRDCTISIKGYYVANKQYGSTAPNDVLIILFLELVPANNHEGLSTLYKWEERLNELRVSSHSDDI